MSYLKEIEQKLLKENWMLFTDYAPMDGEKLRFKKVIDTNKRSMIRWIISKSYEAGLEVANKIINKK